MKIAIRGKVSDMFYLSVSDSEDINIDYDGYVPDIKAIGGGDYIELVIDNDTGKIVGWVPLTVAQIKEACNIEDEEEDM